MSWQPHPVRGLGRALIAAALGLALTVPPAQADGLAVWAECAAGGVTTNHSQSDFEDALSNPPADGAEYSDCEDQIRAAQLRAARGTGSTGSSGNGTGSGATPSTGAGATQNSVTPDALSQALGAAGVNPSAPPAPGGSAAEPPPVTIDGERIDLSKGSIPSLSGALSLPLPLAASAVVVLVSAGLPVVRYLVARFGGPPTGSTPSV